MSMMYWFFNLITIHVQALGKKYAPTEHLLLIFKKNYPCWLSVVRNVDFT